MNTRPATYLYACMPCSCTFEHTYPAKDTMTETPAPEVPDRTLSLLGKSGVRIKRWHLTEAEADTLRDFTAQDRTYFGYPVVVKESGMTETPAPPAPQPDPAPAPQPPSQPPAPAPSPTQPQ